jgi:heat-inducible transcriptional repressor
MVSGHPALVLAPRPQGMRLKHIQFISLSGDGLLIVLISRDNQVQTRFVRTETRYSQELLDRFSQYLNGLCQDLTLAESRQRILARMLEDKNLVDKMISQALSLSRQALQNEEEEELYIEGTSQILDYPEVAEDVAKIRTIFKAFEEKSHLINLLDQTMAAQGVQIIISPEAYFPEMQLSLVASSSRQPPVPWAAWGDRPCAWITAGWSPLCAIPLPWSPTCLTNGKPEELHCASWRTGLVRL